MNATLTMGRDRTRIAFWVLASLVMGVVAVGSCWSVLWPLIGLLVGAYIVAMFRFPELNVIFYYIAGKIGFEERLSVGMGLSANQILQILFIPCLAFAIANGIPKRTFPKITIAFVVVLTAVMTVGLLYTDNLEYGSTKVLGYVLLVLPGIIYLGLRVRNFAALQKISLIILATTSVMMVMGLRGIGDLQHGNRLAVFGGGAIVYARLMGTGVLLLCTYALSLRRSGQRKAAALLLLTLTPGYLVAMYFAGSKGPLLALVVGFSVFAILNRFVRRLLVWGSLIGLVVVGASARSRGFQEAVDLVTASRIFIDPRAKLSYGSYGSRLDFWTYSGDLIAHSPLLGVGTGAWGSQRRLFETRIYPHNIFLEVACEYGLVMVTLLVGFLIWLTRRVRILVRAPLNPQHAIYASGLVACLGFWIATVQVSGDVIDNRNLWIFVVLVEIASRIAEGRAGAVGGRPESTPA
jgi:O-antigen ligase